MTHLAPLLRARALVDEQAEDEGLWFIAETAAEAYLQQELRRLHAAVEVGVPVTDDEAENIAVRLWKMIDDHDCTVSGEHVRRALAAERNAAPTEPTDV